MHGANESHVNVKPFLNPFCVIRSIILNHDDHNIRDRNRSRNREYEQFNLRQERQFIKKVQRNRALFFRVSLSIDHVIVVELGITGRQSKAELVFGTEKQVTPSSDDQT